MGDLRNGPSLAHAAQRAVIELTGDLGVGTLPFANTAPAFGVATRRPDRLRLPRANAAARPDAKRQRADDADDPHWSDCRERAFVEQQLPPDGVFFDIGANAGFYTFFAAAKRPNARVIAFEPVPELAEALKTQRDHQRFAGRRGGGVEDTALSDANGTGEVEGHMRRMMTLLEATNSTMSTQSTA